jgi:hypothetical protein
MRSNYTDWCESNTLSKQIKQGKSVSQKFIWRIDDDGSIVIKAKGSTKAFSSQDYLAMIEHVNSYKSGIPLGSRRDKTVPTDSLGALMQKRRGTSSIRGWCSHLAAVAYDRGHIKYIDKGRGPGRGIWLFPTDAIVEG